MNRALFISDLHIASPQDPKCALFSRFLDKLIEEPSGELFLVGDIFDLWIADRRYFVERYSEIIEKLRRLTALGWRVHYFEGNHDLDLKRFWAQSLGWVVHEGPTHFDLSGLKVRVEHGDQMNPNDRGYIFLRWFLRTPFMRAFGRYMPDSLVRWIGERASRASREYTSSVKGVSEEQSQQMIRQHAERVHRTEPFQLLISGHVHVEMDEFIGQGAKDYRLVNLGTWLKKPYLFELTVEGGTLKSVDDFLKF